MAWSRTVWMLLGAMLFLVGCQCDTEPVELGQCGTTPGWTQVGEGASCPSGPRDCEHDLACVEGVCGSCSDSSECRDGLACGVDGTCGSCTTSAECSDGDTCREGFCMTPVPTWDLALAGEDWSRIHEIPYEDDWYPCVLTAGGVEYADGCEVRSYGSTARTYPKLSLRIRFPEDFDHPGYARKITLRAEYNDPTFLRNHLGYESFRQLMTIPTPRTRFINLTVNDSVYGLFVELERPGGKWLALNDRNRDQSLYEAEHSPVQGGLMPMASLAEYEVLDGREMYNKKTGDKDDISDLASLIEDTMWMDFLDSPSRQETSIERTAAAVEVDSVATYLSIMAMIQNRDHVASNYNISFQRDPTGAPKWEVYPLDLDTSFGCVFNPDRGNNICDSLQSDVWWLSGVAPYEGDVGLPATSWMNLLYHLVLNEPSCSAAFNARICAALAGPYWNEELPRLIQATAQTIRPFVEADPNDLNSSVAEFDAAVTGMLDFLPDRQAYLESSLGCP
jgi:hypothetical protein